MSFLQTIPSLAVFGLLIAPLSALSSALPFLQDLGIRGIGWAPALLALIAYSLLPMVRNTFVAITEVPESLADAARGMGMNEHQVFYQLKLPLALPVMIEGVRITTIQAIGLTAVAALIGAGGFGGFIFQGLGRRRWTWCCSVLCLRLRWRCLPTRYSRCWRPVSSRHRQRPDRGRNWSDDRTEECLPAFRRYHRQWMG